MAQLTRNSGHIKGSLRSVSSQFQHLQFSPVDRFSEAALSRIATGTDYAYAEKILHWRAAFPEPDKLYLLDQYDLQVS